MTNCTEFPVRQNTDLLMFYITNVVLIPVLFGVGLMGNFITTVLCNHSSLRRENAVFIHLCGLAVVDIIALVCTVPETLQKIEIFPVNVTFSRFMAYADMGGYVFGNIVHHAALWLMVSAGFIKLHITKFPYESSRITRNSTNRIIVFISVLICALLNFPRFLEVSVSEVLGHCFGDMSLWDFRVTAFGNQKFVKVIYPWAIIALGYALPLLLILIAMLSLGRRAGWKKLRQTKLALRSSNNDDKRRLGLLKAVWVLLLSGFCLEVPNMVVQIFVYAFPAELMDIKTIRISEAIARYLGLVRASITFVIYTIYCSDFRRAMRRTFCCICACADEFYEPCACCSPTYRRELKETQEAEEKKMKQKERKRNAHKKKEQNGGVTHVNGKSKTSNSRAHHGRPNSHHSPSPYIFSPPVNTDALPAPDTYRSVPRSSNSGREGYTDREPGSVHTHHSDVGSALSVHDTSPNGRVVRVVDPSGNAWV